MMNCSLTEYNLDIPKDFSDYLSVWRLGTTRRPHDHPQYMQLMRSNQQAPRVVVYSEAGVPKIVYPFYLLEIGGSDTFFPRGGFRHIVSAYGYGGPSLLSLDNISEYDCFEKLFNDYIKRNSVISEFVREDIFPSTKIQREFISEKQQDNVVIDLKKNHDDLWKSYKYSVRKNINRALSSNLEVKFDFEGVMTEDFVRIYHMTMQRTNAKKSFFVNMKKFEEFNRFFSDDRVGFYVHVLLDGEVIATELLLRSPRYIYSFLGGSNMDYSQLRPSDYLKHCVNLWAIDEGIEGYVLGGGVRPYDGIYNFKLAFDQNGARPFFIQRNVHNAAVYEDMVEARAVFEKDQGRVWEPNSDFFPAFFS